MQGFYPYAPSFHAFQQTKIKPVKPVNHVKKQCRKSCHKKQVYNLSGIRRKGFFSSGLLRQDIWLKNPD
jgi:hypothetical protein